MVNLFEKHALFAFFLKICDKNTNFYPKYQRYLCMLKIFINFAAINKEHLLYGNSNDRIQTDLAG